MSVDGTLNYVTDTPEPQHHGSCVVQLHDGKLLMLGKYKLTVICLKVHISIPRQLLPFQAAMPVIHTRESTVMTLLLKCLNNFLTYSLQSLMLVVLYFTVQNTIVVQQSILVVAESGVEGILSLLNCLITPKQINGRPVNICFKFSS